MTVACSGWLQESRESGSRKVARKLRGGWGRDGEVDPVDPVSIVFNSSFWLNILVYQLLVYPMIGQLCEFTLTLMSVTWLRARRV